MDVNFFSSFRICYRSSCNTIGIFSRSITSSPTSRVADSRGLLNSSLAGEYSQKAAIETALPIAQQDSQTRTTSGLNQQQGQIQAAQTNLQSDQSARLGALEAKQKSDLLAQDIASQEKTKQWDLTSGDTKAISSAVAVLQESLTSNIASIEQNANMTSAAKQATIANLQAQHKANVNTLANIWNVQIDWA